MKKLELRQLIKEELGVIIDYRRNKPFATIEEWESSWSAKEREEISIKYEENIGKKNLKEVQYVSFTHNLLLDKLRPVFSLLGDNNTGVNKAKFISDVYKSLKKYSTLDAK